MMGRRAQVTKGAAAGVRRAISARDPARPKAGAAAAGSRDTGLTPDAAPTTFIAL
jgi:hypothetical protein